MDIKTIFSKLDKYDYLLIVVLLFALIIILMTMQHCLWIDEGRDLSITRNLITGRGLTLLQNQPFILHPPGFHIFLVIPLLISNFNEMYATFVPLILGVLSILLVYLTSKEIFNNKIGLIASILLSVQYLHWFLSDRILPDIPNTFFMILTLYLFILYEKREKNVFLYLSALALGYATLIKITAVVALIPIFIYLIYKYKLNLFKSKQYYIAVGIFVLIVLPWYLWVSKVTGSLLLPHLNFFNPSADLIDTQPFFYYFELLPSLLTIPILIIFLIGIVYLFFYKSNLPKLLLLWVIILLIFWSFSLIKVDRYILPIIPIILLISAVGLERITKDLFKFNKYIRHSAVVIFLLIVVITSTAFGFSMIPLVAKGFCGLDKVGKWLNQNTNENDFIIVGSTTTLAWYSNRTNITAFPANQSEFKEFTLSHNVKYIVVDAVERTQPKYAFNGNQFWYPYFLNDTTFPAVAVINYDNYPIALIYGVNNTK